MTTYILYHLIDPNTKEIRYVGQTKHTKEVRLLQHIRKTNRKYGYPYRVNHWIKSLLVLEKKPIAVEVFSGLTKEEVNVAEQKEIARLKALGLNLCNLTSGGDSSEMSEETLEKMRQAQKGEKNGFFGKKHTEETKEILRKANLGKTLSEETKEKIRQHVLEHGGSNLGNHHTQEAKEKIKTARAKTYFFISPLGEKTIIKNLKEFCENSGGKLQNNNMWMVSSGRAKHHHGWIKWFPTEEELDGAEIKEKQDHSE